MGPQPSSRGNGGSVASDGGGEPGFNGAATFQSRKYESTAEDGTPSYRLQWGRNLPVAEIGIQRERGEAGDSASMGPQPSSRGNHYAAFRRHPAPNASMGPQPSSRGNQVGGGRRPSIDVLQWGRNLPVAEISSTARASISGERASMGPQPSSRGNFVPMGRYVTRKLASMGPQPSSRGNG